MTDAGGPEDGPPQDRGGPDDGNGVPDGGAAPELGGLLSRLARSMGPEGLQLGGDNVRFEQAPEAGLEVRITLLDDDGAVTSVASMFRPSDEPPAAQPADVPFVPGAALRVIDDRVRDVLLAMWMLEEGGTPGQAEALAAVLRASREAGWRLENPTRPGHTGPFRLVRGDRFRRVETNRGPTGPVVSLSQKRLPADAPERP